MRFNFSGKHRLVNTIQSKVFLIPIFLFVLISPQSALAIPTVSWDFGTHFLGDSPVSGVAPNLITVVDTDVNTPAIDTITITVSSTSNPTGISLLLTETGSGTATFKNTDILFSSGNGEIPLGRTITVTIQNPDANTSSGSIDSLAVNARSTSDPVGLVLSFPETGVNTGIFTGDIKFETLVGGSTGNILNVVEGDKTTVQDLVSTLRANGIITPNPNSGFGIIQASIGNIVTVSYQGVSATTTIGDDTIPGGGGGGGLVIHPSFVLDAILGVGGGGGEDRSPPSFALAKWSDIISSLSDSIRNIILEGDPFTALKPVEDYSRMPLKIGNYGYPLFGYSQTIDTTIVETGKSLPIELSLSDDTGIEHLALYTNVAGIDGDIHKSDTYIIYHEDKDLEIVDPHGFFSDVKFEESKEGTKYGFLFEITFAKPMDTSNIIFRTWDDRRNSADTKIFDAIRVVGEPIVDVSTDVVETRTENVVVPYYKGTAFTFSVKDPQGNVMYYNPFGDLEHKQIAPPHEPFDYPIFVGKSERHDEEFDHIIVSESIRAQIIAQALTADPFDELEVKPAGVSFFYPSGVGRLDREKSNSMMFAMAVEETKAKKIFDILYTDKID